MMPCPQGGRPRAGEPGDPAGRGPRAGGVSWRAFVQLHSVVWVSTAPTTHRDTAHTVEGEEDPQ